MEISSIATCSMVLGLLLLLYILFRDNSGLPGPHGLPFVGYLPFIRADVYQQLVEMTKKYGKNFKVNMGPRSVLVLNDWESIKEGLIQQKEIFANRPNMFTFTLKCKSQEIVSPSPSPIWRHQRRFAVATLRDLGMGKSTAQDVITEELEKFTAYLSNYSGGQIQIHHLFFPSTINIILNLATGERLEYNTPEAKRFATCLDGVFKFLEPHNILNFFPILRHFTKSCSQFKIDNDNSKDFLRKAISEHNTTFSSDNEPKDYIESYLKAMYDTSDNSVKYDEIRSFSDDYLLADLYVFCNGGVETTSSTLEWAVLYMSVWPTIQEKVQKEIDEAIGNSKMPHYNDRHLLPYTHAAILEVQRYASIGPLSVPHSTKCATKLCGFNIPANIEVWINLWALHHDPDLWGDPQVFRPERYIDSGGKVKKPEYLRPFSAGLRRCMGERLAKMELFVIFATVLQRFTFKLPEGHPPPSLEPVPGLTLHPNPFSVIVENRH